MKLREKCGAILLCLSISLLQAQSGVLQTNQQKADPSPVNDRLIGLPSSTLLNINRFSAWYESDGSHERNPETGNAGVRYPRTGSWAIFQSGFLWGGMFSDGSGSGLRVNGQTYITGTKPGAILGIRTGISEDPNDQDVRIWRIRRDYATADLRRDAAELNNVLLDNVTADQIEAVRAQYAVDWNEWPWQKGAPFYDDNGNGVKDTGEEPGLAGADQVVWLVCNDLDVASPWGRPSSGIEEQITVWGFDDPLLQDIIFKRARITYKGRANTPENAVINDMYLTHWSDPDLGNAADDFAGCDTLLELGFVYNGQEADEQYSYYGLAPPAVGFDLIDGPIENLPMTSFIYFAAGGIYSDPPYGADGGTQWYQMMRGLPPQPNGPPDPPPPIDPYTGQPSGPFWLYDKSDGASAPDPLAPTGWVDGMIEIRGDRRIIQSTGPFQLLLGESQEMVIAIVGGSDSSVMHSVRAMKYNSKKAQFVYDGMFTEMPPTVSAVASFSSDPEALVTIRCDSRPSEVLSMFVNLIDHEGELRATAPLYDDGTHGDVTAGDGVFTNEVPVVRSPSPHRIDVSCAYGSGRSFLWEGALTGLATVGSFDLRSPMVFSDNYNADGIPNPGENFRYGFTVHYEGISPLHGVTVLPVGGPEASIREYYNCPIIFLDSVSYDPANPSTYFSADIPREFPDSTLRIPLVIYDRVGNRWTDSLDFAVAPLTAEPRDAVLSHLSGDAGGEFRILVLDTLAVNDHLYVIEGINDNGFLGFNLRDSTDGRILLSNHPFPDLYGHNVPVTDGFRVMRGTIEPVGGWDTTSVPNGSLVWSARSANGLQLEGFDGAMGAGWEEWFSGSSIPSYNARDVLIRFAATDLLGNLVDPNDALASLGYRYLQNADQPPEDSTFLPYIINPDTGFAFQDFNRSIPFSAFDVSRNPPRRLALGFLENNAHWGSVNGIYWPPGPTSGFPRPGENNTFDLGPREWFFVFDTDYSEVPDPQLQVDIEHVTLPLMWWGTPNRNGDIAFFQGDEFMILADYPYLSTDSWSFNPRITVVGVEPLEMPQAYALFQNFPNPFNPSTSIRFSVAQTSRITILIYNILGQQIRKLADEVRTPGTHTVQWDSRNDAGNRIASGVYLCRMTALNVRGGDPSFTAVRKLLVIK